MLSDADTLQLPPLVAPAGAHTERRYRDPDDPVGADAQDIRSGPNDCTLGSCQSSRRRVTIGGAGGVSPPSLTPAALQRLSSGPPNPEPRPMRPRSASLVESVVSSATRQENEATASLFTRPRRRPTIAVPEGTARSSSPSPAQPLSPEVDAPPTPRDTPSDTLRGTSPTPHKAGRISRHASRYSVEAMRPPRVHPDVSAAYSFISVLGAGSFGTVWAARQKATGDLAAIKIVDRTSQSDGDFSLEPNEVEVLKQCSDHAHIVKLLDYFASDTCVYLAMELVEGGDLQHRLDSDGPYADADGARIFTQVVSAVHHLHEQSITHRDIKPENIMFSHSAADAPVKLTDFGLSTRKTGRLTAKCGTPSYSAPELLSGVGYGREVDLWALGVLAYVLVVGVLPFTGEDRHALFKAIQAGHFSYPSECSVSPLARDVIWRLLRTSPLDRYSTRETLQHPWVAGRGAVSDQPAFPAAAAAPLDTVLEMMCRFNAQERWRRVALVLVAVAKFRRAGAARARLSGRGAGREGGGARGVGLLEGRAAQPTNSDSRAPSADAEWRGAAVGFGGGGDAGHDGGMHTKELLPGTWAEPSPRCANRPGKKESQQLRASDERPAGHVGAGGYGSGGPGGVCELGRARSSVQLGTRYSPSPSPSPEAGRVPSRDGWRTGADTVGGRPHGAGWDGAGHELAPSIRQLGTTSCSHPGCPQHSRNPALARLLAPPRIAWRHSSVAGAGNASSGAATSSGGEGEPYRQASSPCGGRPMTPSDGANGPTRQNRSLSVELLRAGVGRVRLARARTSGSGLLGPGSAALARAESSSRSPELPRPRDNNTDTRESILTGISSEAGTGRPVRAKSPAFMDERIARSRSRQSLGRP